MHRAVQKGKPPNIARRILQKMFFVAFYTTIVIQISQTGAGLIDGIVTARFYGSLEMAAIGLVYPYFAIACTLSGCLATGMKSMCTKEFGRGRIDQSNRIFSETFTVGIFLSFLMTVVMLVFTPQIIRLLGAKGDAENLFSMAKEYYVGLVLGTPGLFLAEILSPAVQLDNGERYVQAGAIASAVTNIAFDCIAALSGMSLWAIGFATSLSNYANLAVLLLHFANRNRVISFRFGRLDLSELKEVVSLGSSKLSRRIANIIRPILLNQLAIAVGGSLVMSVMSVRNSVNSFVFIFSASIAGAVSILAGLFYGEVNEDDLVQTGKIAHRYNSICSVVILAAMLLFSRPLAVFYLGADSEVLDLMTFALLCVAIQSFFSTLTRSRISYLMALCQVKSAQLLEVLLNLIYIVLCAYGLSIPFGAYGIMAAFPAADLLVLVTVYALYAVRNRTPLPTVKQYTHLDDSFHLGPGDLIDLSITNSEEVSLTSAQIMLFCKGHKLDHKKSYYASLCAEELAQLIIENGFSENAKPHSIDIRLVIRGQELVMRMRDNCKSFSLVNQAKLIQDNPDPAANLGVKMIYKTAKDINCYRTMGANITIITI